MIRFFIPGDTGQVYRVPENYAVNQSPPMSVNSALGQTYILESQESLKELLGVDAKASMGAAPFSVDMSLQTMRSTETSENRYYAIRRNFIPIWEVYLPDIYSAAADLDLSEIPAPFDRAQKEKYSDFFARFGTHVVKRVWVGGKAMLTLTVSKESGLSQEDIRAGLTMTSAAGGGSASQHQNQQRESLLSSSEVTVSGEGGDKLKLGALRSLDDAGYEAWMATVCQNPKVIEMEVLGIWNIIDDKEKADALKQAYKASINHKPISLVENWGSDLLFVYGTQGVLFDPISNKINDTGTIPELIQGLPEEFPTVDFILDYGNVMGDLPGRENKIYLFYDRMFACYDKKKKCVDEGYPKLIKGKDKNGKPYWPGLDFDRIDAAINWGDGCAYFFSGPNYIRYNLEKDRADPGYPKPIQPNWSGVTFEYIDAAVTWDYQKAFFFKGNEVIRFNMVRYQADPGYPKTLTSGYIEDWQLD